MTMQPRRYLVFCAHPDDCDLLFGGTAVKLAKAGHAVKFVSVCNGDCGHYAMTHEALARRRHGEAQASARLAGVEEYQILGNSDCRVENTLANREEIIRIIRRFRPDVVLSHRNCDYHVDHRVTGQLVMDAAYLLKVPMYCEDTPIPDRNPVFAYVYDRFRNPRPLRVDAAVEIDSVVETKMRMLNCHTSQFYEWLPWDPGCRACDASKMTWEEKLVWLHRTWGRRFENAADLGRATLQEIYGEAGLAVKQAEVFELSEYGQQVSIEEFRALFPR